MQSHRWRPSRQWLERPTTSTLLSLKLAVASNRSSFSPIWRPSRSRSSMRKFYLQSTTWSSQPQDPILELIPRTKESGLWSPRWSRALRPTWRRSTRSLASLGKRFRRPADTRSSMWIRRIRRSSSSSSRTNRRSPPSLMSAILCLSSFRRSPLWLLRRSTGWLRLQRWCTAVSRSSRLTPRPARSSNTHSTMCSRSRTTPSNQWRRRSTARSSPTISFTNHPRRRPSKSPSSTIRPTTICSF